MNDFLRIEYESCLSLLKYYDDRQLSLVKFTTGASSSIVALMFGFHTFRTGAQPYFWHFVTALSGVATLGLLAVFAAMVQNRLYFIYPARQVNAIRRAMLAQVTTEFSDNQMYLTTDVRAFKFLSLNTFMNLLVAMQIGGFLALGCFAIFVDAANAARSVLQAFGIAVVASAALFGLSAAYLNNRGQYHPDRAVHLIEEETK